MAAGDPTGGDLCSGTTNGDTLATYGSWTEREITIDTPVELTSGVKYAIVIRATGSDATNSMFWSANRVGSYANGSAYNSSDSGSSWAELASGIDDFWFTIKSSGVVKDSYNDTHTLSYGVGQTAWRAQTFTASSTYTINSIILKLSKNGAASIGTVTASIRATESAGPSKATTPAPTDANSDVTLDQATLTWVDGGGATSYNVYYGTVSGSLSLVSAGQASESLTVTGITNGSPYDYEVTRYWRIDSINAGGTTTGDEWSFTTIVFYQVQTSYMLISGGSGSGPYDSPPGAEGTDWRYTGENAITHVERLVAAAENRIWYEGI